MPLSAGPVAAQFFLCRQFLPFRRFLLCLLCLPFHLCHVYLLFHRWAGEHNGKTSFVREMPNHPLKPTRVPRLSLIVGLPVHVEAQSRC